MNEYDLETPIAVVEISSGTRAVNMSLVVFGFILLVCGVVFTVGWLAKRRRLSNSALTLAVITLVVWGGLFVMRPAWLRVATQTIVPTPTVSPLRWIQRSSGLETSELMFSVQGEIVDRMMLIRLDPQHYRFSIHWDPTDRRTAEQWQQEFQAAVVVNGSYFGDHFVPLTPLRIHGCSFGPTTYVSQHGAFVIDGAYVNILDLHHTDAFNAIGQFPDAMVSYPLLLDAAGNNRAVESPGWLASRNFLGLDVDDHIILGATETGFFTLHRLGEFLRNGPLALRIALNLDGGPLVAQVVRAGAFTRSVHGTAEISNGSDVLRVFWHMVFETTWTLPIVLMAHPVERSPVQPDGRVFLKEGFKVEQMRTHDGFLTEYHCIKTGDINIAQ